MNKIKIISDSSCDLSKEIIEKYKIDIVPLNISFGEEIYVDGELEKKEFYRKMKESKELPKTSCPSPDMFLKSYEGEEDVIVLTIASKLSGTYSSALLAKSMYEENNPNKKIAVIDSESGSVAQGLLAIKGYDMIREGKTFEEIVERLESIKKDIVFYGTLETLENAIKGGRINPLAGKIINALNFKAIIKIGDGEVKPIDKARGDKNSIKKVIDKVCDTINEDENKSLIISHANCIEKANKVKELMLEKHSFENILIEEVGAVIGTYSSEGAILIAAL
ncbi:DegV family protein [Terrisporobacter mayombei]|nr:DegV family protein [Terrisporobacter mayombei]